MPKSEKKPKLKWSPTSTRLLYFMLKAPQQLHQNAPPPGVQPYATPEDAPAMKQVRTLHKMVDFLTINQKDQPGRVSFQPYEGNLKSHLVDRIRELLKHFEPVLRLAPNVPDYLEFKLALDGQEDKVEPWDDTEKPEKKARKDEPAEPAEPAKKE